MPQSSPAPHSQWHDFRHTYGAYVVLAAIVVLFGIGDWGFALKHPVAGANDQALLNLYLTLQLFTFQFPSDMVDLPWQLHVAKFGLPLAAIAETIILFGGRLVRTARLAFQAHRTNRILISVGTNPAGMNLLHQVNHARARCAVVAVGLKPDQIDDLEQHNVQAYSGSPLHRRTWTRAQVRRASKVIVAHGGDVENLNATVMARQVLASGTSMTPPELLVLIENDETAAKINEILTAPGSQLNWNKFSATDESARDLFLRQPLALSKADRLVRSHVLILGFGAGAAEALRNALVYAQDCPDVGPEITIVARREACKHHWLLNPGAVPDFVANITVVEWGGTHTLPDNLQNVMRSLPPVSLVCVCLPDEEGLACGLELARMENALLPSSTRVAVYQSQEDSILHNLNKNSINKFRMIQPFGAIFPKSFVENLLGTKDGDLIARQIHNNYLSDLRSHGVKTGTDEEWHNLRQTFREASRSAANHIAVKLAAIGCEAHRGGGGLSEFSPEQIETLARIEHRRWSAERVLNGWRFAPKRDNANRLHNNLLPFDDLPAVDAEAQGKDRATVAALPALLKSVGQQIVPAAVSLAR